MSELVQVTRRDGVLIAAVNNPPVNALSPGVPEGLLAAVREAAANDGIHAVVIIGTGRTFIAGADIRELARIVSGEAPPLNLAALLDEPPCAVVPASSAPAPPLPMSRGPAEEEAEVRLRERYAALGVAAAL